MAKRKSGQIGAYPCIIYSLHDKNPEFHKGYRFRIHDIDDDQWLFVDKDRMYEQLVIHGMQPITPEKMEELRRQRSQKQT